MGLTDFYFLDVVQKQEDAPVDVFRSLETHKYTSVDDVLMTIDWRVIAVCRLVGGDQLADYLYSADTGNHVITDDMT